MVGASRHRQKWFIAAISGLVLPNPPRPPFTEFKTNYVDDQLFSCQLTLGHRRNIASASLHHHYFHVQAS